jgi:hypothetical protein
MLGEMLLRSTLLLVVEWFGVRVSWGGRIVRSYAFVLHRWWRFLAAIGVSWDRATAAETRDLVL